MKSCPVETFAQHYKKLDEINKQKLELLSNGHNIPASEYDTREREIKQSLENENFALKQRCGIEFKDIKCSSAQMKSIFRDLKELTEKQSQLFNKYDKGEIKKSEFTIEVNKLQSLIDGLSIESKTACGVDIGSSKELLEKGKNIPNL